MKPKRCRIFYRSVVVFLIFFCYFFPHHKHHDSARGVTVLSDAVRARRLLRGGFLLLGAADLLTTGLERHQVRVTVPGVDRSVRKGPGRHEGTSTAPRLQVPLRLRHQRYEQPQDIRHLQRHTGLPGISRLFQDLNMASTKF